MMHVAEAVARGRQAVAGIFLDKCVIERRVGRVLNETTLEYVDKWAPVYAGACRVKVEGTQPAESEPGGRTFVITDAVVQLPIGPERFVDNDRVTVTVAVFDPDLVGVALSVTSREVKSQATMRRLHVSEVSS